MTLQEWDKSTVTGFQEAVTHQVGDDHAARRQPAPHPSRQTPKPKQTLQHCTAVRWQLAFKAAEVQPKYTFHGYNIFK